MIGLTAGKTLALARGLPFLGVNHLEAHIYANWLRTEMTGEATDDNASETAGEAAAPDDERMARRSALSAAGAGDLRRP